MPIEVVVEPGLVPVLDRTVFLRSGLEADLADKDCQRIVLEEFRKIAHWQPSEA